MTTRYDLNRVGACHIFGDDVVHDNGIIDFSYIIGRETNPDVIAANLFAAIDPGFATRVRFGDVIIAGKNFAAGKAHTTAYFGMAALGLIILCQSSFEQVIVGAANLGVPIVAGCVGLNDLLRPGEPVDVDLSAGVVVRADGATISIPPLRPDLARIIELGGRKGILEQWLRDHPEMALEPEAVV